MVLHYLYPTTIFLYFAISSLVSVFTLQNRSVSKRTNAAQPSRLATLGLLGLFVSAHVAQLIIILSISAAGKAWPAHDDIVVGHLSCILIFGLQLSRLYDNPQPLWYPFHGSWILALPFEALIGVSGWFSSNSREAPSVLAVVGAGLVSLRCVLLGALLSLLCCCARRTAPVADEERQSLLNKDNSAKNGTSQKGSQNGQSPYGSTTQSDDSSDDQPELPWEQQRRKAREAMEKRLEADGNWLNYAKDFLVGP